MGLVKLGEPKLYLPCTGIHLVYDLVNESKLFSVVRLVSKSDAGRGAMYSQEMFFIIYVVWCVTMDVIKKVWGLHAHLIVSKIKRSTKNRTDLERNVLPYGQVRPFVTKFS